MLEFIVAYGLLLVVINTVVISLGIKKWTNNFNNTDRGVKLFAAALVPINIWMVLGIILMITY